MSSRCEYIRYKKAEKRKAFWKYVIKEILLPIIILVCLGLALAYGFIWASDSHDFFKVVPKGEITLLENQETIYVPKGAYILGEAHPYSASEDVVFDEPLPKNQKTDCEELVRTSGEVVIYWSLDQKMAAEELLGN